MFKKKTVLSHHAYTDHDEHHNHFAEQTREKERESERKRERNTKQPTNLVFISSTRLSMH
jgi:hypothetical protein